ELMNRDISREGMREIFGKLRARVPGIAIRTSVMVGFPGESDEDFEQLRDFVIEQKFDHLGCFTYSQEEGTVAGRMKDQIEEQLKLDRQGEIMAIQREISADRLTDYVGKTVDVLVKGLSDESDLLAEGRLSTQAPEVDGVVYINDGDFKPGTIQRVLITDSHDYDLVGKVIS
ncbi:MAG: TRAM domain-containing protein, partial [Proteobacteria bacterium]